MPFKNRTALMCATAVMASAGCGSSGTATLSTSDAAASGTVTSTPKRSSASLTSGELLAKGNAICQKLEHERAAYPIRTAADFARVGPAIAALDRAAAAKMAELTAPPSMSHDWTEIVSLNNMIATDAAKVAESAKASNPTEASRYLAESGPQQAQLSAIYKHDGFTACEDKS